MEFFKMDGAGNDFVVIDNRTGSFQATPELVSRICHRRFGVGADGLMTLDKSDEDYDFEMHYYNSDGHLGSMCGNGGRCIAAFAHTLGLGSQLRFKAYDGAHSARIETWDDKTKKGYVALGMRDVAIRDILPIAEGWALDTGSPHFVLSVKDLEHYDVYDEGRRWRNRADLFPEGVNVDFVEMLPDGTLFVRTYERGVEDETWACGTGVTASALVTRCHKIATRGGDFNVEFNIGSQGYTNICLCGPVAINFTGIWTSSQA